ncbi:MAG: hypothetical protein SVG88_07795 [Halobacteriales archaeon]|nr:hypothetical protein [Halobacteriales archaeon]
MSTDTSSLKDIYLDVAGDDPITESQQEEPSHDPIEESEAAMEEEVSTFVQENGLDDAVEGAEISV